MVSHWDVAASTYAGAQAAVWAAEDATDACLAWLAPAFPPGAQCVADIGAGIGRLAVPFADLHPDCLVVAVEPSAAMARWISRRPNLLVRSALPDLPLDGAYSMVTFQHLPATEQAAYVAQVASLLRPGGVLRFQWQTHGDTGPLAHPVPEAQMVGWCERSGLEVAAVEHGFVWDDQPPWGWITAVTR